MGAPTFLELARSIDRKLAGNINWPYRVLDQLAEVISENDYYLAIDATLNDVVATLPDAADAKPGLPYWIIRTDGILANSVTIAATGGQTINGAASVTIGLQYSSLQIVSDGSNWLLFAGPAAYALSSDVLWVFGAQISTDQNSSLFDLKAKRAMSFVAFDATVRIAPAGSSILIDWSINGIIDPALQVEILAGATFGQIIAAKSLAVDDVIRPIISQVGSTTPGETIVMRARGQ